MRYPSSTFILLEREPAEWFQSLKLFFAGKPLEDDLFHARVYSMEKRFVDCKQRGLPFTIEDRHAEQYMRAYVNRNARVRDFFGRVAPDRFFYAKLGDDALWDDLASFLGKENSVGNVHANKRR